MTEEKIGEAVNHFKKGEVVIFPTETVLGIGCSIFFPEAIIRVYQIKGRNFSQPTHILVSDLEMASEYGDFSNPLTLKLADHFWPGPLTIIVPLKNNQSQYQSLANSEGKIGIRVPSLPDLRTMIRGVGTPILGPSANKAGEKPPTKIVEIDKSLLPLVDYTVNQDSGGLPPSTIVEVLGNSINMIREGLITKEKINKALDLVH